MKIEETVFIFDLDDTLYQEAEYQSSGFKEIARWIQKIYGLNLDRDINNLVKNGDVDILGGICHEVGLPFTVKESLLWIYRTHQPEITLAPDVRILLSKLKSESSGVAILTDGRSITQRLKLKALGLTDYPSYISEEYGEEKPSLGRFQAIMNDFPASKYVYIGDNPNKDFIAPNHLGWITIGLTAAGHNMHKYDLNNMNEEQIPDFWISNLYELHTRLF